MWWSLYSSSKTQTQTPLIKRMETPKTAGENVCQQAYGYCRKAVVRRGGGCDQSGMDCDPYYTVFKHGFEIHS